MDYKVNFRYTLTSSRLFSTDLNSSLVVTDCDSVDDAEKTVRQDIPRIVSIASYELVDGKDFFEFKSLALSKRVYAYLINFKYGENDDVTRKMVVKQCHNEKEAEEGFRCMFKDPETIIKNIVLWNYKIVDDLEEDWTILTLQQLKDYRDGK